MAIDLAMFQIDPNSPIPRYYQIHRNIVEMIESGMLTEGEALPSERVLSEAYGVHRMTLRQAIDSLARSGFVRVEHGVGTFVRNPGLAQFMPDSLGFSERIRNAGKHPSSRVLAIDVIPASPTAQQQLRLPPNSQVIALRRLRLANDEPLIIETSYLPHARFSALAVQDLERRSLYDLLKQLYQVRITSTERTLEPTLLRSDEADLFGLPAGFPAMLVHITAFAEDESPVEFSKSVMRGDRCRFYFRAATRESVVG